jgi:hypothetical protein
VSEYLIKIEGKTTDSGRKLAPHNKFEAWLREHFPFKEIGWKDIGEVFYRYQLAKTRWFNIYLHVLDAPEWHPVGCHDHPWAFLTVLLSGGYLERQAIRVYTKTVGSKLNRRWPGMVLYRSAEHAHDVITPYGTSWSLVITGPKKRDWGFKSCEA